MTGLFDLPSEVLLGILGQVNPGDLDPVSRTCRFLNRFVKGNRALYRDMYLRILDPPPINDLDWEKELHDVVRLQRICASSDPNKPSHLPVVHDVTTRLLNHATPHHNATASNHCTGNLHWAPTRSSNAELLADIFASASTHDAFLNRSFLYDRARGIPIIPARALTRAGGHGSRSRFQPQPQPGHGADHHQMSAHLHCLYGMPGGRTSTTTTDEKMYPFACSKVYDLRESTDKTGWGPFRADGSGRVDWEKVEAILLVLRENIRRKGLDGYSLFGNVWGRPFAGTWKGSYSGGGGSICTPTSYKSFVGKGLEEKEKVEEGGKDPFGVAGTWMRVVCFLDYDEFFRYNFPPDDELPDDVPRQALDTMEAVRLILMKIWVTKVVPPGINNHRKYPVVHFKGVSRSVDGPWEENANSDLRGTVWMTPEGDVRWTTYSIFNGEERWKSEGIQLGGVRSARGVVGNWFDKNYDPHGPCGPTAFWKIADWNPRSTDKMFGQDPTVIDLPANSIQYEDHLSSASEFGEINDPFQSQFHIITHLINGYGSGANTDSSGDISLDPDPPFFHPLNSTVTESSHYDQDEELDGDGEGQGEEGSGSGGDGDEDDNDLDDDPDDEDWRETCFQSNP